MGKRKKTEESTAAAVEQVSTMQPSIPAPAPVAEVAPPQPAALEGFGRRCPDCGSLKTAAYKTRGRTQYRRCFHENGRPRHRYKVTLPRDHRGNSC